MNKVFLIIQREYMVRVKKKSFLLMTFLVPGLILIMYAVIGVLLVNKSGQELSVVNVIDKSGVFKGKFKDTKQVKFVTGEQDIVKAKAELKDHNTFYVLDIAADYTKKDAVQVYAAKTPGLEPSNQIENQMNDIATNDQMVKAGIDTASLHKIRSNIDVNTKQLTETGEKDAGVGAALAMSIAGAILVYISLFIYGAQVMRGVLEEKTSRIIEVVVSSVKPFQLMMGKIIGVGMVGLTQFMLWIILSAGVSVVATGVIFKNKVPAQTEIHGKKIVAPQSTVPQSPVVKFFSGIDSSNVVKELGGFIFYFLTGYLLYSALFAAVGSAVDSETETQQFMFPITLPLLFTYILSVSYLFQAPNSTLAVWLSMIPFTAPVVMMVRMPFDPPAWQIALSAFMMIVGFLFTTWVAARIYRVGILMYGKKTSYKELAKWFFYKE
ncbi:ABC transporter permease [Mucilaginibacter mali]|uniref:ABC transporter permease n=1 Tax=Mucilaginibacter mali TaxID=2740462 RepID=A0A7D4QJY5_9SPHI|nr:ABC transporter permease [Mucilaginibacter mali]QKJ30010.1 ABC transporter permease [Mucilaginibacter mali]